MKTFNGLNRLLAVCALVLAAFSLAAHAQEAPDALVKRLSQEVLEVIKSEKDVLAANPKRALELAEAKILPYVDFQKTTSLVVGRHWRDATPEQKEQLTTEFRTLLVYTYSSALSQFKDQRIEFKPLRMEPDDTEAEVRTQVVQPRGGEPVQVNYRLVKTTDGWKIYDVSVLGAWLVETYKGNFSTEVNKGGIDGLIRTLVEKNKGLAANSGSARKGAAAG